MILLMAMSANRKNRKNDILSLHSDPRYCGLICVKSFDFRKVTVARNDNARGYIR